MRYFILTIAIMWALAATAFAVFSWNQTEDLKSRLGHVETTSATNFKAVDHLTDSQAKTVKVMGGILENQQAILKLFKLKARNDEQS